MKLFSAVLALAGVVPCVVGHGFLSDVCVGGQCWSTFQYWNQDLTTPVRVTDYLLPNYDVEDRQIACGLNARKSTGIATVSPGTRIEWGWRTDTDKTWVHKEGTSRTFIGSCQGDCSTVDETTIEWWEISYRGQEGSYWPVHDLNSGGRWVESFPSGIPNGDYLLRTELLALHYSTDYAMSKKEGHMWGTEFYPSCMAIRVENGSGSWPDEVVKFPGAYSPNIAGHYNPTLWQQGFVHTKPGLNLIARSGGNPNPPAETSTSSPAEGTPISTSVSDSPSGDASSSSTSALAVETPQPMCGGRRVRKRNATVRHRRGNNHIWGQSGH